MSIGLLAHESTKRHNRRDARKEEEDGGRETLHVDTILQHTGVHPRIVAVLHVVDHTPEKSEIQHHMWDAVLQKQSCCKARRQHSDSGGRGSFSSDFGPFSWFENWSSNWLYRGNLEF